MQNVSVMDERYPDLLATEDGAARAVVRDLDAALSASLTPDQRASIARALREQVIAPRRAGRPIWRRRLVRVTLSVVAAMLLAGAAYAYTSLTDQAYKYSPSLGRAMDKYAHAIHASASVCGYTLDVTQAYADANRVTVSYTLGGPPSRHFVSMESDWPVLSDAHRTRFEHLNLGESADMANGVAGHFATFDASHVTQHARRLTLRLTLPVVSMVEKLDGTEPAAAPCESYRDVGTTISVGGFTGRARIVTVHRPLSVTLTVPVDPARREVAPHKALTVGGTTLILERVVVTRTEARVYLRRGTPGHILENAAVTLTIGKHRYGEGIPLFGDWWVKGAPASRLYDFWFEGPFYDYHGSWRLDVAPQPGVMTAPWRVLKGGPWHFRFTVP